MRVRRDACVHVRVRVCQENESGSISKELEGTQTDIGNKNLGGRGLPRPLFSGRGNPSSSLNAFFGKRERSSVRGAPPLFKILESGTQDNPRGIAPPFN